MRRLLQRSLGQTAAVWETGNAWYWCSPTSCALLLLAAEDLCVQSWCYKPTPMSFDSIASEKLDQPQLAGTARRAERSSLNFCIWGPAIEQKTEGHLHKHDLLQSISAKDCTRPRQRGQKGYARGAPISRRPAACAPQGVMTLCRPATLCQSAGIERMISALHKMRLPSQVMSR